jgi:glycerol kinase
VNIGTLDWDDDLLSLYDIPRALLPEIVPSSGVVAHTDPSLFGVSLPIAGIAGDQQAATFGQACIAPGMAKNTYGTGLFLLMNTGSAPVASSHRLITTIGWQCNGARSYALEGSVFMGGAIIQWLRDGLGIIASAPEIEGLAAQCVTSEGVVLAPAFAGLGAPYWDPYARGTIIGLSRGTGRAHIARAALEAIAFQTVDVLNAMEADANISVSELRVDGGASQCDLLLQIQADLLGRPVVRPSVIETTALGAAYLAGLAVGYWAGLEEISSQWRAARRFEPTMSADERHKRIADWHRAIERSLAWEQPNETSSCH